MGRINVKIILILCVVGLYSSLLSQESKEDPSIVKKALVEKQKQLKETFEKFVEKLGKVSKRLKGQNVEYARRIENAILFIKSEGVGSLFEQILSALAQDNIKISTAIESTNYLLEKLDRILEILENKMRREEMKKQMKELEKKSAALKDLIKEQERLMKERANISKDVKEMEDLKEALEKFITTQKSLKKLTDKNTETKKESKKIFELQKDLKKLADKHSRFNDELVKNMPEDSADLISMLNKLNELERKMNKSQKFMKAIKDLENKLSPNNKNNLEKEIDDLLNKANNIQKKLEEFKKDGNIPDNENVAKQLQKFAKEVANFQDKFLKYPFKTKRFNKLMETLFKSQSAFEFTSHLAEENLAGETTQEFQKAREYLAISKKLLKGLPEEVKQKSAKELGEKIHEQQKEAEQISKNAEDYLKNNKPADKDLEKGLKDLKSVPQDLESAKKNAELPEKIDTAQVDHEVAFNKVQNAISQIKKSLGGKQGGNKNEQLAREMDKLMKEAENMQNKLEEGLEDVMKEHEEDENMKDAIEEAKESFNRARKNIKKQAEDVHSGNNEQAALKDKEVKKDLKNTIGALENLRKMLSKIPKQNELAGAQEKLNKDFEQAMKNFEGSRNAGVQESSKKAQEASPHMKEASQHLKRNSNKNASAEQQRAIEKMQRALENLEKKMAEKQRELSEEDKKKLAKLAEEQKKLAQMTKQFATKEKKSKVKKEIEEAARQMAMAARAMRAGNQNEAKKRQDMAYKLLKKALQKLSENKLQYESEEALSQLEQMELTITEVYEAQKKVYEKTVEYYKRKTSERELSRQLLKDIKDLATAQQKIIPDAEFLVRGFREQGALVFVRIMEFVVADMQLSAKQLQNNDVGPYTQSIQEDILKNLETLLGSLKFEVRKLKMRSGGGGGGGGGQGRQPPKIPPLAEIKLIKAMEVNVKLKTEKLLEEAEKMFNNANEPKQRLEIWQKEFKQRLQKVIYDQEQVADLTEKVKARMQR